MAGSPNEPFLADTSRCASLDDALTLATADFEGVASPGTSLGAAYPEETWMAVALGLLLSKVPSAHTIVAAGLAFHTR